MIEKEKISAQCYAKMIAGGAVNLKEHVQEINDLNVFPIPDGDTGENMLLTMLGGAKLKDSQENNLSELSRKISNAMLLSARGNSGVILSQFMRGISKGLKGKETCDIKEFSDALLLGSQAAYKAVMKPTEGTILTVAREVGERAVKTAESSDDFVEVLIASVKRGNKVLAKTQEMLPALKKAGVVDSGGAGFIYIAEGMRKSFENEVVFTDDAYNLFSTRITGMSKNDFSHYFQKYAFEIFDAKKDRKRKPGATNPTSCLVGIAFKGGLK